QLTGTTVKDLQLEVADQDDFVVTVAIDIMNLEGKIVGEQSVARIGASGLPENLAVQRDGGKTTDVIMTVAGDARDVLRNQHLDRAGAIEIAEADAASGTELRGGKPLP